MRPEWLLLSGTRKFFSGNSTRRGRRAVRVVGSDPRLQEEGFDLLNSALETGAV
jgi:hypothetical protein